MAKQSKSYLRFDLFALKEGEQVVSHYPELAYYPAFVEHGSGDNDQWARFAILYSDIGSEFRDLSIDYKRERCMQAAGVSKDSPRRADVLAGKDAGVLALIIEYVRLQDWMEYAALFHGREYIWELISTLSSADYSGVVADKKSTKGSQAPAKDKNANLAFALENVGVLDQRWKALWMNDTEVKNAAQQISQRNKLFGESRAESRTFIPKPE